MNFYCLVTVAYADSRTGTQRRKTVLGTKGPMQAMNELLKNENHNQVANQTDGGKVYRGEHIIYSQTLSREEYDVIMEEYLTPNPS